MTNRANTTPTPDQETQITGLDAGGEARIISTGPIGIEVDMTDESGAPTWHRSHTTTGPANLAYQYPGTRIKIVNTAAANNTIRVTA
jgi:hypothetical protein